MRLWMAHISFAVSLLISVQAYAEGKVLLNLSDIPQGKTKKVTVEVMRVDIDPAGVRKVSLPVCWVMAK